MRILLIEDDEILIDALQQTLTSQHYVVDTVDDGRSGWDYAQSADYDLILMDVGLPGLDGISLCQRLRSQGNSTPILLITARDATGDRIRGLDAGADDYLIKPLDLAELQARVRALLRRGAVPAAPVLQVGNLRLDPSTVQVSYGEKPLNLTPKEYSLLELFLRNPSRVFSRGQIVQHLWTFDDPPLEESVKAHIKGLRQKLKATGAVDWIENVYGIGYRLKEGVGAGGDGGGGEMGRWGDGEKVVSSHPISSSPYPPLTSIASPSTEQQFNHALTGLWDQYRGLMAQRLEALQQAATALQMGNLTETVRQDAGRAAHKLAGVLGMFEKDDGTLLARELEQILQAEVSSEQESRVLTLVQEMTSLLNLGETESTLPPETAKLLQTQLLQRSRTQTIRVLVVDDDWVFLGVLRSLLEPWGISMTGLDDPLRFWETLRVVAPDLLILDVEMPEVNGIELCQSVRADPTWQGLPILFLTAHKDSQTVQQVFTAGADDFIIKPVVGPELLTRIINRLERNRLLQNLSTQDPITGLANQPHASRDLERLLQTAAASQQPLCLAVLTVVELRQINLQYGHVAGNKVLEQWGQVLKSSFRGDEVCSYWGNGEFIVGLPGLKQTEAQECLADVMSSLRRKVFASIDGQRFQSTCQMAIAEFPTHGQTIQSLYQAAGSCNK